MDKTNEDTSEVTTKDILEFMTSFQNSVKNKIKSTNEILEDRINVIDKEIIDIKDKFDKKETEDKNVQERMDRRLARLAMEMKNPWQ